MFRSREVAYPKDHLLKEVRLETDYFIQEADRRSQQINGAGAIAAPGNLSGEGGRLSSDLDLSAPIMNSGNSPSLRAVGTFMKLLSDIMVHWPTYNDLPITRHPRLCRRVRSITESRDLRSSKQDLTVDKIGGATER
jgi:hypothetical protein